MGEKKIHREILSQIANSGRSRSYFSFHFMELKCGDGKTSGLKDDVPSKHATVRGTTQRPAQGCGQTALLCFLPSFSSQLSSSFPRCPQCCQNKTESTEGNPQERPEAEGESENRPVLRSTSISFPPSQPRAGLCSSNFPFKKLS